MLVPKYHANCLKKKKKSALNWSLLALLVEFHCVPEIIHLSGCHFGLRWVAEALVHCALRTARLYVLDDTGMH